MRVRAFRGGLQVRLLQAKIGLLSFVTRFAHRVERENLDHSKEYIVSGCLKQVKCQGMGCFIP